MMEIIKQRMESEEKMILDELDYKDSLDDGLLIFESNDMEALDTCIFNDLKELIW